ncbi:gp16 [Orgyia pseudotsugata multiple nucleopolyhedrovirus]|uniref:GP16 protein n=1 Tax=Orgyia pseudotsugata multicapsid polyhedrosis virus TaxID=262177 RepID=VP16_NPVOP|nr:gp16 [Orgyia pseudotsugata multiple nucleopolyhedrovirus]P24079.1 RecName: Full=GP16 protein [Orgyia pseudotsugata multiple nucleopolyhedrovirus]pir/T10397/ protein gp16 - Orgyia pseudotsugata nuclear polyhedrosis virus [Orgyia pseudotsugata single capsid nuclopolyhedrovirus]AKR14089.1 glycoprotein 16 [Dasychira pudibunda nucleopolyhedrovirus]AAC59127.1 gp16 [Orgyia pseudotsugata multiple nucleopolyhedrovirus]WHM28330.1 gp16 [Dasychira pudibunda nucleopolyhedrovirus]BAA02950.3 unnamed prot
MNFWAAFSACLVGYLVYSGRLNGELQEIKSILIIAYEAADKRYRGVIDEIESLKTDTFMMLSNLQNNTIRTWDAVAKNGKKIANLDERVNGLLAKHAVPALVR